MSLKTVGKGQGTIENTWVTFRFLPPLLYFRLGAEILDVCRCFNKMKKHTFHIFFQQKSKQLTFYSLTFSVYYPIPHVFLFSETCMTLCFRARSKKHVLVLWGAARKEASENNVGGLKNMDQVTG